MADLKGLHVLAVDDEKDILDTIEDVLDEARVDRAEDYDSASQKLKETKYDLAILDIMGVNGLVLLAEAVERGIPTVMLTAHSSKRPYEFNAGGSGSDLLRMKCLSERCGFSVDFESTRCKYIPEDSDMCPGKISKCKFITKSSECLSSGGSTFSVKFPASYSI